jgi:hypothetical protein
MKMNENSAIREIYGIRSKMHQETKGMSPKERADFINKRADSSLEAYNAIKASGAFSPAYLDAPSPIAEPMAVQEIHAIRRQIYEQTRVQGAVN